MTTAREHLRQLASEEFDLKIAPLSTPSYTRSLIRRTPEYAVLQNDLRNGLLTEAMIRDFVDSLLREYRQGHRFIYETALAALAVLMESSFSHFAEEFLLDLARLRLREMSNAIQVARECLRHRSSLPRTRMKSYHVEQVPWQEFAHVPHRANLRRQYRLSVKSIETDYATA